MNNKNIILILSLSFIILSLLILSVTSILLQSQTQDKGDERYQVSDRVSVDKDIIKGYEGEDYIPRCVACNDRN